MTAQLAWEEESVERFVAQRVRRKGDAVDVWGCARVHLGAIDLAGEHPSGGGFGFAVPELSFIARVSPGGQSANPLPRQLRAVLPLAAARAGLDLSGLMIELLGGIPEHRGLGSTTQYLVAALQGSLAFLGRDVATPLQLSELGIGADSSLGIRLAFDGRPLLDLGRDRSCRRTTGFPTRRPRTGALRMQFPSRWRALVAWPDSYAGLNHEEDSIFWEGTLPVADERTHMAASALLLDVLPGVASRCFNTFESGLAKLNEAGVKPEEWDIQPSAVAELAEALRQAGYVPVLSSVGPALVVFGETTTSLHRACTMVESREEWTYLVTKFSREGIA